MFLWTEWPSMTGEADWIRYYARLIEFATTKEIKFNRVILRMIDPTFGAIGGVMPTNRDLWTVSENSVVYQEFISKLPAGFDLVVYPYVMDADNQVAWKSSMATSGVLEAVFKYMSQWNTLLSSLDSKVNFSGIVVDGEERRGYVTEIDLVTEYKAQYGGWFGYCTGYPQVGVISAYASSVDAFFLQMYDFYVDRSPSLVLVQNTDVTTPAEFIDRLNSLVWSRFLPYYESSKVHFMWSLQNSAAATCLYPDGPTTCGIKEDFGTQTESYFVSFLAQLKDMYPSKFGNKPHGFFQFSFTPDSWYTPTK
jgi:hypothetical protein